MPLARLRYVVSDVSTLSHFLVTLLEVLDPSPGNLVRLQEGFGSGVNGSEQCHASDHGSELDLGA